MSAISFLPVLAAGVASVLVGVLWYSPAVFGAAWMRMENFTPEMVERGKKRRWLSAVIGLIASMLIAWVMSYVGLLLGVYDWFGAVELGFWCWLGFVAPTMLGMVLWEQRPFKLYLIVALNWLVSFIVMALVLTLGSQLIAQQSYGGSTDGGYQVTE
jgi:hypothetical protein